MGITTKSSFEERFPVIDITHKPKRMQGAFIPEVEATNPESGDEQLTSVTLERAILIMEEKSKFTRSQGERLLFHAVATWLKEYLSIRGKIVKESNNEQSDV